MCGGIGEPLDPAAQCTSFEHQAVLTIQRVCVCIWHERCITPTVQVRRAEPDPEAAQAVRRVGQGWALRMDPGPAVPAER